MTVHQNLFMQRMPQILHVGEQDNFSYFSTVWWVILWMDEIPHDLETMIVGWFL